MQYYSTATCNARTECRRYARMEPVWPAEWCQAARDSESPSPDRLGHPQHTVCGVPGCQVATGNYYRAADESHANFLPTVRGASRPPVSRPAMGPAPGWTRHLLPPLSSTASRNNLKGIACHSISTFVSIGKRCESCCGPTRRAAAPGSAAGGEQAKASCTASTTP